MCGVVQRGPWTSSTEDRLGCLAVRRALQAFLDGEVEARHAELIAAHLESCRRCGVEARTLEAVIVALRRMRADLDAETYTRLRRVVDRLAADRGNEPPR